MGRAESPDDGVRVLLATAPDSQVGAELARKLVEERLAACVNLLPEVRSFYRWEGRLEDAREVMLVIKTAETRCAALIERLRALHPYELPEIVALPVVDGSAPYLDWVRGESQS